MTDHTLELLRRMDGKLDRMASDISDATQRLTRLEATSHGMAEDVRFVRNTMSAMERAHASQVETSATLMERMDRLQDQVDALTRRVEDVEDH